MTTSIQKKKPVHIIYLHGFRSSPHSVKANQLKKKLIEYQYESLFYAPFLNQSPEQAIGELMQYIAHHSDQPLVLIGSSLGGFYATWLAEYYQLPVVLINPAITPWLDLKDYLGKQPLYHGGGEIEITADYFDQLLSLSIPTITLAQRYFLLASTHDDVISYQSMLEHYPNTHQISIEGGDHGVSNFENYLDSVLQFCQTQACAPKQTLIHSKRKIIDNTLKLNCLAQQVFEIKHEQDLLALTHASTLDKNNWLVLGGCSNVILPADISQPTLLMQIKKRALIEDTQSDVLIELAAGESWHDAVAWSIDQNWTGLENLALIPGTAGATPIQNIGAYGVDIANTIESVKVFDTNNRTFNWISATACELSYRHSIFKTKPEWIVVAIRLRLKKYTQDTYQPCLAYQDLKHYFEPVSVVKITPKMVFDAVVEIRQRKLPNPLLVPNVGSFFKNPIIDHTQFLTIQNQLPERSYLLQESIDKQAPAHYKIFAARLIEFSGLKGARVGGASISTQHSLVLINQGQATRADVDQLVLLIQTCIMSQFALRLHTEPVFI